VRLVELLKQPQFQPMNLSKQIVVLFAGTRGYLDKYKVDKIAAYEQQLLGFVDTKHSAIMKEIEEKKIISPELEKKLKDMLTEFDSVFIAE